MQTTQKPLFKLGRLTATPGFLTAVPRPAMVDAIRRYATGDFGELSETDARITRWSARNGRRVAASYRHGSTRFLITTEADRSGTRICLPEEHPGPSPGGASAAQ